MRPLDSEVHGWRWCVRRSSVAREAQAAESKRSGCEGERANVEGEADGSVSRRATSGLGQQAYKASWGITARNKLSVLRNHCIRRHVLHMAFCIFTSLFHYGASLAKCRNVGAYSSTISRHGRYHTILWISCTISTRLCTAFLAPAFIHIWMPFLDTATARL